MDRIATLSELKQVLADLPPGGEARLDLVVHSLLFPPGEPDENARIATIKFAEAAGCEVRRDRDRSDSEKDAIVFTKARPGPW